MDFGWHKKQPHTFMCEAEKSMLYSWNYSVVDEVTLSQTFG